MSELSEIRRLTHELGAMQRSCAELTAKKESLGKIIEWADGEIRLEKNDVSRSHKALEAFKANRCHNYIKNVPLEGVQELFGVATHIFVVRHDWASALGEHLKDAEVRLPYPACVFEFRVSGRTAIVFAFQEPESEKLVSLLFVEGENGYWLTGEEEDRESSHGTYLWRQVAAICIALEAKVADEEHVLAPAALNKKRAAAGKVPLLDYHIVDLSKRHRVTASHVGSHTKKRLHFRRGHWRHYTDTFKVWINWMLVGNPDLGFIDKGYKL